MINRKELLFLCLVLLISLSCCCLSDVKTIGNKKGEVLWKEGITYKKENFCLFREDCYVTAACLYNNGKVEPIEEKTYKRIMGKRESMASELSESKDFIISKVECSYCKENAKRISTIFANSSSIALSEKIKLDRIILKDGKSFEDDRIIHDVDELICSEYPVDLSGESCMNEDYFFNTSGKFKYAAIIFVPKILTIIGWYNHGNEVQELELQYPFIEKGYVEGVFLLIESNDIDRIAALGC